MPKHFGNGTRQKGTYVSSLDYSQLFGIYAGTLSCSLFAWVVMVPHAPQSTRTHVTTHNMPMGTECWDKN